MDNALKCPYCGSTDYDIYDSITCYPENTDYCVCEDCGTYFEAVYIYSHVVVHENLI